MVLSMKIERTTVLITGASRGLGKALAKRMADGGARVVMVARGREELDRAVTEARSGGGEAHGITFDVAEKSAVHRISGAAAALVGPIDILVHAASSLGPLPMPLLLDTECEDFGAVIETNLLAPFRLTKAIAGSMLLRERGLVMFVSSDAAIDAYPRWGAYGVSKAAQDHLARSFASEIPNVRFLAVDPGEMDTQMHADALPDADRAKLAKPSDVAGKIVTIVRCASSIPNGARLRAADFAIEGGTR